MRQEKWEEEQLHGQFIQMAMMKLTKTLEHGYKKIQRITLIKTSKKLRKTLECGKLQPQTTKSLITTAQDNAIRMNHMKAKIEKTHGRCCKNSNLFL